jgi:pantoate--beta-alanine ligase
MECKSIEIYPLMAIFGLLQPYLSMILIKTKADLQKHISTLKALNNTLRFVPTMGALHAGHLALITESRKASDITACSIFVNPTQFNNPSDLEKYPVTLEKDIDMLESAGCDLLFLPSVAEMYPPGEKAIHYELGYLETILEGKYRPGHFQGVCQIVDKLLMAVQPHQLFMGRKDYQQCMVIKKLLELKGSDTRLIVCDTVREPDGLAMSSRNMRLNPQEKKQALHIIHTLTELKNTMLQGELHPQLSRATDSLEAHGFKVDYVAIADAENLAPVSNWDGRQQLVGLVAAYLNEVRLIDNIALT